MNGSVEPSFGLGEARHRRVACHAEHERTVRRSLGIGNRLFDDGSRQCRKRHPQRIVALGALTWESPDALTRRIIRTKVEFGQPYPGDFFAPHRDEDLQAIERFKGIAERSRRDPYLAQFLERMIAVALAFLGGFLDRSDRIGFDDFLDNAPIEEGTGISEITISGHWRFDCVRANKRGNVGADN